MIFQKINENIIKIQQLILKSGLRTPNPAQFRLPIIGIHCTLLISRVTYVVMFPDQVIILSVTVACVDVRHIITSGTHA